MRLRYIIDLAVLVAILGIAGCGSSPRQPSAAQRTGVIQEPGSTSASVKGKAIAALAQRMIGIPYVYGGESPSEGFDCSGLVYYTHTRMGIRVPRTAASQLQAARRVDSRDLSAGDLLFFNDSQKVSHVGIYLGGRRFVHAPQSGSVVSEASLDNEYYRRHLEAAARLYR